MPRGYWAGSDVFVPLVFGEEEERQRHKRSLCAWARLREGVSLAEAQVAIDSASQAEHDEGSVKLVVPAENQSRYFAGLIGLPLIF